MRAEDNGKEQVDISKIISQVKFLLNKEDRDTQVRIIIKEGAAKDG